MSLHKEINLELEICRHPAAHDWLYADGDAANYDRARALFPADVISWVQTAHPQAWQTLVKNHGASANETLLACTTARPTRSTRHARCVASWH